MVEGSNSCQRGHGFRAGDCGHTFGAVILNSDSVARFRPWTPARIGGHHTIHSQCRRPEQRKPDRQLGEYSGIIPGQCAYGDRDRCRDQPQSPGGAPARVELQPRRGKCDGGSEAGARTAARVPQPVTARSKWKSSGNGTADGLNGPGLSPLTLSKGNYDSIHSGALQLF